uniref:NAD-dependent epimerase/dehydratase family protein n=1 Tax=Roseivirga sp. TaxID=1964215 RepID=UPI004048A48B
MKVSVLVLGHRGLLGTTVSNFFDSVGFEVIETDHRWPSIEFKEFVGGFKGDYIINCIGGIPQKGYDDNGFYDLNFELPKWLGDISTECRIIFPTTDCEFSGNLTAGDYYSKADKPDASDAYGLSKIKLTNYLLEVQKANHKIVRTSIIGLESKGSFSLMSWFMNATGEVNGFEDHYWNGLTTLEWSKMALKLMFNWEQTPHLLQLGTEGMSKFELLNLIKEVFELDIEVNPVARGLHNKNLASDFPVKDIRQQLIEYKKYYKL